MELGIYRLAEINKGGGLRQKAGGLASQYLDGTGAWANMPTSMTPTAHNHSASEITSGELALARIPTGTTSSTVALGNHTHSYAGSASAGGPATTALACTGSSASVANALTVGTGISLNSGTTYDGSSAKTISINQGFTPTWTGKHIFTGGISGTTGSFSSSVSAASFSGVGSSLTSLNASNISSGVLPIFAKNFSVYDVAAYNKRGTPVFESSVDGSTWTTISGFMDLFYMKQNSGTPIQINDSNPYVRVTWENCFAWAVITSFVIGVKWSSPLATVSAKLYSSADGSSWTLRGSLIALPSQTETTIPCTNNGGNGYIRIVFERTNESGSLNICSIRLLSPRCGDQGGSDAQSLIYSVSSVNNEVTFPAGLTATTFTGALSGNAATATKLATARTISLTGSVTGSVSFDGSGDVSITTETNHSHAWSSVTDKPSSYSPTSHASSANTYGLATASLYGHAMASSATPLVAGTASVGTDNGKFAREDHVHPAQTSVSGSSASCTGNAATATKLATARTLTIGNTGKDFDGSQPVSWTLAEIGANQWQYGQYGDGSIKTNAATATGLRSGDGAKPYVYWTALAGQDMKAGGLAGTDQKWMLISPSTVATYSYGGVEYTYNNATANYVFLILIDNADFIGSATSPFNVCRIIANAGTNYLYSYRTILTVGTPITGNVYPVIVSTDSSTAPSGITYTESVSLYAPLKTSSPDYTGNYSVSSGQYSVASGLASVASGQYSVASGNYSVASGYASVATGYNSVASGQYSVASGGRSVASGYASVSSGYYSVSSGYNSVASGYASVSSGYYSVASGASQTVIGKYNAANTSSAFIIGNGTSTSARSNCMTVDFSGNMTLAGSVAIGATGDLTISKHAGLNRIAYFDAFGKVQSDSNTLVTSFSKTNHNHDTAYLQLSGGTVTGTITLDSTGGIYKSGWDGNRIAYFVSGELTTSEYYTLSSFALAGHNHDGVYSLAAHTHSGYAASTHNHDSAYSAIGHDHSGTYALAAHTHDYAATSHTHSGYAASTHLHSIPELYCGVPDIVSGRLLISGSGASSNPVWLDAGTNGKILGWTSGAPAWVDAPDHNHDSTYLKLSGGTLTGALTGTSATLTGTLTAGTLNGSGLTASRAVVTDGSKNLVSSTVTADQIGYLSAVTSSVQGQLDGKLGLISGGTVYGATSFRGIVSHGRDYYNVLTFSGKLTYTEILIKTRIPYINYHIMPVIRIFGYAYGAASPIDLNIAFYIYGGNFINLGCMTACPWGPVIKLFTYDDSGTTYVGVALMTSIYFPRFSVSYQDIWEGEPRGYATGWTIETNTTATSIVPSDNLTTVPYRTIANNAATATKLATTRAISLTGSVTGSVSFDGSGDVSITTTTNHTHSYLPLAGGTVTGKITLDTNGSIYKSGWDGNRIAYFVSGELTTSSDYTLSSFALAGHNHDGVYSLAAHTHSGYAASTHNHDSAYSAIGHDHSGTYALAAHTHDYAATSHTHSGYAASTHLHSIPELYCGVPDIVSGRLLISGSGASSNPTWMAAGTNGKILGWTSGAPAWVDAPSGGSTVSPANPTASVGLAAVNGTAATFMRSDAAPKLDVSISPTWTGNHTFNGLTQLANVGIGVAPSSAYKLYVVEDKAITVDGNYIGTYCIAKYNTALTSGTRQGIALLGQLWATGGTLTHAKGLDFKVYVPSGTVQEVTAINAVIQTDGGSIGTAYALKLSRSGNAPTVANYGIYQDDATATNVFNGPVQFNGGTNLTTGGRARNIRFMTASGTIDHTSGTDTLIIVTSQNNAVLTLPTSATTGDRIEFYSTLATASFDCASAKIWPINNSSAQVDTWGGGMGAPAYCFAIWDGTYWRVGYLSPGY